MSDDVKKVGLRPVVPATQDAIEPHDHDAPVADDTVADTYVQFELNDQIITNSASGPASAFFRPEEQAIYIEAARLRGELTSHIWNVRQAAVHLYGHLALKFAEGAPEVYPGAAALRTAMKDTSLGGGIFAAYEHLAGKFSHGSPEVYSEAEALRRLMQDSERGVCINAIAAYKALSTKFAKGSPEVYKGAKVMRRLMEHSDVDVCMLATDAYRTLCAKFVEGSSENYSEVLALQRLMEHPEPQHISLSSIGFPFRLPSLERMGWEVTKISVRVIAKITEGLPNVAVEANAALKLYTQNPTFIGDLLKANFIQLSRVGFFKAGFESGIWIEDLGLSDKAARNLRGFAGQPRFIGFRDSVTTMLDFLSKLDDDRRAVASRVFEATDPAKWKSVRNTLSTIRAISALDSLPEEVSKEFYRSHRDIEGDSRAVLRSDVEKTLLSFLREKAGEDEGSAMLFRESAPDEPADAMRWRGAQAVRRHLLEKGLITLFAQSASFMDEEGVGILRSLLGEFSVIRVEGGELQHQKRYDRMVEKLGFSPVFVERWRREWRNVRESAGEAVDAGAARALVMKQAAAQLAAHVNSIPGVGGEFRDLPDRLRMLINSLRSQEADDRGIGSLHEIMELNYGKIRETYGDLFANARIDLKNLVTGLTRGVKVARRTVLTEITGLVEKLAFHGMIPTETCQRLSSLYAEMTNGHGQPLNKLLWGQFKLANYVIDDEVMARRMLEVTRDEEGIEHLLVERAYTAGGFARLEEFDEDIVEHARGIGIDRDRVHFLDRHEKRPVPGPLATGALIYRDSGLREVSPAMMKPFQPLPVMTMPMMSAAMMLRTGT